MSMETCGLGRRPGARNAGSNWGSIELVDQIRRLLSHLCNVGDFEIGYKCKQYISFFVGKLSVSSDLH